MIQQPNKAEVVNRARQQAGGQVTTMKFGRFYGKMEADKPAGNGMFEFTNGDIYCGTFNGGITGTGNKRIIQESTFTQMVRSTKGAIKMG